MSRTPKFQLFCFLVLMFLVLAGLSAWRPAAEQHKAQNPPAQSQTRAAQVQRVTSPAKLAVTDDSHHSQIEASYGNLPLSFEPNRGQTDSRVKFLSRAGHRTLWLTNNEAVLAVGRLPGPHLSNHTGEKKTLQTNEFTPTVLRMKFVGANANPRIAGEARQPSTVNYFIGKPDQWRTKVPTYARVRYSSLYPGVDLSFYGNNQELEYDVVVSPGADPGQIRLALTGADEIRIDDEGNLVLKTSQGDVIQQKPRIYQRSGTTLKPVSGDYVLTAKNEVGFRLGSYDPHAAVVIDPVLRYSTFLSGSSFDNGSSIAVDSQNRAVVAGETCSADFPVTGSSTPAGCSTFIAKLDFTGSRLIFSAFLPNAANFPQVALDPAGNVYVAGTTGSNFPTTPGAFQTARGGGQDSFVTKLNSNGTTLVYSTLLGGAGMETTGGIAVDSSGSAYVTGSTESIDFPTTPGAFQRECSRRSDGSCSSSFVTKLNATGSKLLYSTFLGGHGSTGGSGIAVDRGGHAFITGGTQASDFPTTAGTEQPVFAGMADAFVSEISSSGSHLIYSTYLGGTDEEGGLAIALDAQGNAFITGSTTSTDFPVKNPLQTFERHCTSAGTVCVMNVFVSKLNRNGRLVYSTYLDGGIQGTSIAATPGGQAYVAAFTQIDTFPITQNAFQRVLAGAVDNTLTKFSPTGKLIYSTFLGGNGGDFDPAVALDRDTNAYMTGTILSDPTASSTFPVTPGAFQQKSRGGGDGFVAKIVSLCALGTVNRSVTICSPGNGSTVKSPVRIIAGTTDVTPVKLTQVYLDGKKIYETRLSAINVGLPIAAGTHRLTVQGLDTAKVFFKKSISINVSPH
jgi:Beta-propeller repeat